MDLLTFAAQRDADLVAATDEYTPQVEAALAEPDPADSHAALLLVLATGFAAAYLADGGDESSKTDATAAFVAMMRSAVELTEPDGTEAQVERVSTWFATATLGAATLAAAESNAAPGDVLVKTWVTMRDDKVRDTHAPLDGEFREMRDTFEVKTDPPADLQFPGQPVGPVEAWINCVVGSTQVEWPGQDVIAVTRYVATGDFIDVRTVDGHVLTVTPNHPILTPTGYVNAGLLGPGDSVMAATFPDPPHVADAPPSIQQVYEAARVTGDVQRVAVSRVDFHGDKPNHEVEVVWADGDLATQFGVQRSEKVLVGSCVGEPSFGGDGSAQLHRAEGVASRGPRRPTARTVGCTGDGTALGWGHGLHSDVAGLGAGADSHAEFTKSADDDAAVDVEVARHLEHAVARGVTITEVVEVYRYFGSHPVYNLHTSENYYMSNGIVTHNCRCVLSVSMEPLVASAHDLIWVEGRRTPKVVPAGKSYKPSDAEGKITKRRKATKDEERTIRNGDWVRVNQDGTKPGEPGYMKRKSKVRPQHNAASTDTFAAATTGGFSGVVLVALPAGDGTVTYEDGDTTELHQTLAYLGKVDELQPGEREELLAVGEALASMVAPFSARVAGLASLGENQDTVAITESSDLQALHEMARSNETIEAMYQGRNSHPTWISHVTAQDYQAGDEIEFDRIGVWFGGDDHRTFAMTGEPVAAAGDMNEDVTDMEDSVGEPPVPDMLLEPVDVDQPVYGVIAPEGVMSGDGRSFEPGSTTTRELPLPLSWVRSATKEHDNSIIVGRVDTIDRRSDGNLWWSGVILGDVLESDEVILLIAEQALRGVSVDMDSAEIVQQSEPDASGNVDTQYAGRVSGLTIVAIPAFEESFIALGTDPALNTPEETPVATQDVAAASETQAFGRGPGWLTNPEDTRRIHDYWTKGEGAAKIRWGTPGDFTRLRRHLAKYINPQYLNRTVAQWHHDALGYWPGQCGMPGNPPCGKKRDKVPGIRGLALDITESKDAPMTASNYAPIPLVNHSHSINMVAAAPPATLPGEWFDDPKLGGPTPLTVTASGQVFGHIAKWGTCHIGIDKVCVTPPKSAQNYAYFHLGAVLTSDGERSVGALTLGTGHADLRLSSAETSRHYDHTGTVVAMVRAGEDDHGIWVAGALCEGVTEAQARTLMAAGGISGDWRSIGGHLELVAALAVNVPGFPVPRPALAASAGRQTALVAAGVVVANDDPRIDAIAAAVVEKLTAAAARKSRLDGLAPVQSETRARRVAALQNIS